MRDIRFKAKRLDNAEWVEGDLYHNVRGFECCIGQQEKDDVYIYPVDSTTVCQFTGLKDMKDEEIWEHDLLVESSSLVILELKWNSNRCCYSLYIEGTNALVEHNFAEYPVNNYRVLGNRFDRKEAEK